MNCQFCEDYEWSKKHRPKTGRELYTKYYVCLYERTLRKGCGLTSTYTHKRRPLNFCPECGAKKPQVPVANASWTCSCGAVNTGKFCTNCGSPKPAMKPRYRCDKCGWEPEDPTNPPKFCPNCGDPFNENDTQ